MQASLRQGCDRMDCVFRFWDRKLGFSAESAGQVLSTRMP